MSYVQLKRFSLVLAQYFRTIPDSRVGVLLPSSTGALIVFLALQFAGKVPVMLNWTIGSLALNEVAKATQINRVISSWKFLDKLSHVDLGQLSDKIELIEDIRKKISLRQKLRGAFLSLLSCKPLLRCLDLQKIDPQSTCLIFFTSGSEFTPKIVPLTHQNVVYIAKGSLDAFENHLSAKDIFFCFLPFFHCFGLNGLTLFPLLTGIRVAFFPNPTDAIAVAERFEKWQATVCGAPSSLLLKVFSAAEPKQLMKMRFYLTGGEKTDESLSKFVDQFGGSQKIMDGYGLTETSGAICVVRPGSLRIGCGQLGFNMSLITIHPETHELLKEGEEGEICLHGPAVFDGYLNAKTPFIHFHGKRWFRTGDLGSINREGFVTICGRLKRFTKIGGEMISLGAVEDVLAEQLKNAKKILSDLKSIAVLADEKNPSKSKLVLFSIENLEVEMVNTLLRQAGFSNLVKISKLITIPEIPLMGTGKTDYPELHKMLV